MICLSVGMQELGFITMLLVCCRSQAVIDQRQAMAGQKYDLSKWRYAELRDAINTSCG